MAKDLKDSSLEELQKKKRLVGTVFGIMIGFIIVSLGAVIYFYLKRGFSPLMVIPFAMMPSLYVYYVLIKTIKSEIKLR